MLERPTHASAVLIAVAAIVVSTARALASGPDLYSLATIALGVAMLVIGTWWLSRQAPNTPFREMAIPAAVATVVPLLVGAGLGRPGLGSEVISWVLAGAAAATLGVCIADSLPHRYRIQGTLLTVALAVIGAALGVIGSGRSLGAQESMGVLGGMAIAAATVAPGLIAAVLRRSMASSDGGRKSIVEALEFAILGITPAIAVITMWGAGDPRQAIPLVVWIIGVLAVQFFAVRPLARSATAATTQRDQVVAAMEAERSRIAADIHDDALQELTMLGWRLDSAGDREGAASARDVADRLRAILGDLRLPILDDLGTGPALEWLVDRVARAADSDVRLERGDQVRPPAAVELAFFRVAQEAISNAVRHGQPPVVVRYWTSPSSASLSVDDAGPGIDTAQAERFASGHFGLVNMRQRAEQIGALLDIRRWPAGGTRVTMEWRA